MNHCGDEAAHGLGEGIPHRGLNTPLVLAVGTEFTGTSDRVWDGRPGFASWIGEGIDGNGHMSSS